MGAGSIWGDIVNFFGGHSKNSSYERAKQEALDNRTFQAEQAKNANDFTAQQNAINRDFQTQMSNTAVQRRMTDLQGAGINPILAGMQAADAPTGNSGMGVAASGSQAPIDSSNGLIETLKIVAGMVKSASSAKRVE